MNNTEGFFEMKPRFIKKGKGIVFIDSEGNEWDAKIVQDVITASKHKQKYEEIMNYFSSFDY